MNNQDTERYEIPDANEIATIENTTQLTGALLALYGLNGDGWEGLRESLYKFCLKEIESMGADGKVIRINNVGPKIWGFLKGYIACHHVWSHEIEKLTVWLEEKYHLK